MTIIKKKKAKGKARGSVQGLNTSTLSHHLDARSIGSLSNPESNLLNIFQEGLKQKITTQIKKKKKTTVINETLQQQLRKEIEREKEIKKKKIMDKIDVWDLGI